MAHVLKASTAATFQFHMGYVPRPSRHEGRPDMTNRKFLLQRAIGLLTTLAAFAFVIDGAKRW